MAVGRIVTTTYRYKPPSRKRKAVAIEAHRFPEQPANTTYWLSTNIELKKAPITLHVEGCSILRRSRWRKLRVLTGPLTSAQVAVLPDRGYQTCGRCKPSASA
jgi:hypothetical protein